MTQSAYAIRLPSGLIELHTIRHSPDDAWSAMLDARPGPAPRVIYSQGELEGQGYRLTMVRVQDLGGYL